MAAPGPPLPLCKGLTSLDYHHNIHQLSLYTPAQPPFSNTHPHPLLILPAGPSLNDTLTICLIISLLQSRLYPTPWLHLLARSPHWGDEIRDTLTELPDSSPRVTFLDSSQQACCHSMHCISYGWVIQRATHHSRARIYTPRYPDFIPWCHHHVSQFCKYINSCHRDYMNELYTPGLQ